MVLMHGDTVLDMIGKFVSQKELDNCLDTLMKIYQGLKDSDNQN